MDAPSLIQGDSVTVVIMFSCILSPQIVGVVHHSRSLRWCFLWESPGGDWRLQLLHIPVVVALDLNHSRNMCPRAGRWQPWQWSVDLLDNQRNQQNDSCVYRLHKFFQQLGICQVHVVCNGGDSCDIWRLAGGCQILAGSHDHLIFTMKIPYTWQDGLYVYWNIFSDEQGVMTVVSIDLLDCLWCCIDTSVHWLHPILHMMSQWQLTHCLLLNFPFI